MGRLVVRRSGRTQLVFGNVAFDVSAGSTSSCLQVDLALCYLPASYETCHMQAAGAEFKLLISVDEQSCIRSAFAITGNLKSDL